MGGSEGAELLSWHPLQNNWMAYRVTPRSLIAMFCSWVAERRSSLHSCRKALRCLDITKSNHCLRIIYWAMFAFQYWLRLKVSAVHCQNAAVSFYHPLKHHSLWAWTTSWNIFSPFHLHHRVTRWVTRGCSICRFSAVAWYLEMSRFPGAFQTR